MGFTFQNTVSLQIYGLNKFMTKHPCVLVEVIKYKRYPKISCHLCVPVSVKYAKCFIIFVKWSWGSPTFIAVVLCFVWWQSSLSISRKKYWPCLSALQRKYKPFWPSIFLHTYVCTLCIDCKLIFIKIVA